MGSRGLLRMGLRLKPRSAVYWSRLAFALIAAVLAFALQLKGTVPVAGLAIFVYAASVAFVKYVLKLDGEKLKGRYAILTIGWGTFIMVWLTALIVLFTLAPY